jgi:HAD superfamily hydrolase (TIGR01549 family)
LSGAGDLAAVTFDCWNTLIHERDAEAVRARRFEALADAARAAGASADAATLRAVFAATWDEHVRLWRSRVPSGAPEMARHALAALGVETEERAADLARDWHAAGLADGAAMLPGADETLARLARRGVRRALVCDTGFNSGRVVRRLLERHGLLASLEVVVFSDEAGVPKPDPRVFRLALAPLGVPPARALHVGDLRATDVAGARGMGMGSIRIRACHDDTSPEPDADRVADSHAHLWTMLGLD